MAQVQIPLGPVDRVVRLFSFPNQPTAAEALPATVTHWFGQTLKRDGLHGAIARVGIAADNLTLQLEGPDPAAAAFAAYADRLPKLLDNGWTALTTVVPDLAAKGLWDPQGVGWRFFLPLGLAMANQKALQFFHYPPIRLLETMRDYLNDPVPVRVAKLLEANGVPNDEAAWLYETVVDATPIAAPDDQGSLPVPKDKYPMGLIPIQYFHDYQRAQTSLLLNTSATYPGYTVPIVVYGSHPNQTFSELYGIKLGVNVAATAEVLPGLKTPVLGANHPYRFYAQTQIDPATKADVGSGKIIPANCAGAVQVMIQDLIVARWMKLMADDPSQDPQTVLGDCTTYWQSADRKGQVCALVRHEGSLRYPDPNSLAFRFDVSPQQAATWCQAHGNDPCAAS